MRRYRTLSTLLALAVLFLALPAAVSAEEPVKQSQPLFAVKVAAGVVEVTFLAAMSEVSNYPVTIVAISGAIEEVLYQGVLSEGIYVFKAPLKQIPPGPLKVVVKTNIKNRSAQGNAQYIIYKTWEGSYSR